LLEAGSASAVPATLARIETSYNRSLGHELGLGLATRAPRAFRWENQQVASIPQQKSQDEILRAAL